MLSELVQLDRSPRAKRNNRRAIEKRTIEIMKESKPRCDKGGCSKHTGRCTMDFAWEAAWAKAEDELNSPEELE